jgi:hypothetical protein
MASIMRSRTSTIANGRLGSGGCSCSSVRSLKRRTGDRHSDFMVISRSWRIAPALLFQLEACSKVAALRARIRFVGMEIHRVEMQVVKEVPEKGNHGIRAVSLAPQFPLAEIDANLPGTMFAVDVVTTDHSHKLVVMRVNGVTDAPAVRRPVSFPNRLAKLREGSPAWNAAAPVLEHIVEAPPIATAQLFFGKTPNSRTKPYTSSVYLSMFRIHLSDHMTLFYRSALHSSRPKCRRTMEEAQ